MLLLPRNCVSCADAFFCTLSLFRRDILAHPSLQQRTRLEDKKDRSMPGQTMPNRPQQNRCARNPSGSTKLKTCESQLGLLEGRSSVAMEAPKQTSRVRSVTWKSTSRPVAKQKSMAFPTTCGLAYCRKSRTCSVRLPTVSVLPMQLTKAPANHALANLSYLSTN